MDDKSATDQQSLQSGVSLNTSPGSNPQNYLLAAVNQAAKSTNPIVSPTSQERYSSSSATDPSVTSKVHTGINLLLLNNHRLTSHWWIFWTLFT